MSNETKTKAPATTRSWSGVDMSAKGERFELLSHNAEFAFDEVHCRAGAYSIRVATVERWKESELSGDEWRFSYSVWIANYHKEQLIAKNNYGPTIAHALTYVPSLMHQQLRAWSDALTKDDRVEYYKRRHLLCVETAAHPMELILKLPHLHNEAFDGALGPGHRRAHDCCQPACTNKPVVSYALKNRYRNDGSIVEVRPYNANTVYYRQFCAEHATRGDCALEDADYNYKKLAEIPRE